MFALKLPNQLASLFVRIKKESRFLLLKPTGFWQVVELVLWPAEAAGDSLPHLNFSFLLEHLLRKGSQREGCTLLESYSKDGGRHLDKQLVRKRVGGELLKNELKQRSISQFNGERVMCVYVRMWSGWSPNYRLLRNNGACGGHGCFLKQLLVETLVNVCVHSRIVCW